MRLNLETGKFYFIKDNYYEKFNNCNLIGNKVINGEHRGRPCFYCCEIKGYYWMIPISSKVDKYETIYNEKIRRYNGNFDGIRFGYVNGEKRAFLIQNICPITEEYIDCIYRIQNNTRDVTINNELAEELRKITRKVLRLYDKGIKIVLTDLDKILSII